MNTILEKERQEHLKYEAESKKKYENIVKELQEQKNNNDEMNNALKSERQEHLKYEAESKKKYENTVKELQEQKNNSDEMNKQLLKCKSDNEQLREKQKDHDELIKEYDKLKKQIVSIRDQMNDHNDKRNEYNCEGRISICKYSENMIISNNADKNKVNNLLKYLIKEKDKHEKKTNSDEKVHEILFMKKKEVTTKDNDNVSSHTEEDIFISNDMIDILYENGSLNSIELENELKIIPYIYFDIQYPTPNFERNYSEIIKLKKNLSNKINISIFYEGKENTDQRFHNNKEINRLCFGNSVKNIKSSGSNGSFEGCSSLTSVSIPSSVTSIGDSVFYGCTKLNDIKIEPFKEKKINYFENKFLVFKSDLVNDIYDILLWVNPNNETINVPKFIKTIGGGAFRGCSSLTSVSIPSSVTSIGSSAFFGCSSLASVSIPSSLDIGSVGFNQKVKITKN